MSGRKLKVDHSASMSIGQLGKRNTIPTRGIVVPQSPIGQRYRFSHQTGPHSLRFLLLAGAASINVIGARVELWSGRRRILRSPSRSRGRPECLGLCRALCCPAIGGLLSLNFEPARPSAELAQDSTV
jgi:hypothetical protein